MVKPNLTIMKKLFFLLTAFALFLSCSSDETSTPVTPQPAPIVKYTITLSAGEGGSVSSTGGEYEAGQTVSSNTTLTANFQRINPEDYFNVSLGQGGDFSINACQFFYECENCKTVLKPKEGDCCVYCSYGTVSCPPIQENKSCC